LRERLDLPEGADELLTVALTHKSFAEGQAVPHYERLEFLGDSVLGLVVSQYLYESFPDAEEGGLTKRKTNLVSEPSLAVAARRLELGRYARLGRGEESTAMRDRPSVLSDLFESVLAVTYLTGGLEGARRFLEAHLLTRADLSRDENYKSLLQEATQLRFKLTPHYVIVSSEGPEHAPSFSAAVTLRGQPLGHGEGASKKTAQQAAARAALERLNRAGDSVDLDELIAAPAPDAGAGAATSSGGVVAITNARGGSE
jgi:ribonuclease-3